MAITTAHLTNDSFGFPAGAKRRVKPPVLLIVHITGNASNLGPDAAMAERNYANRPTNGTDGRAVSAHDYLNRDGSGVEAVDPALYAAWSNGDVQSPKTWLPIVQAILGLKAKGYNANEAVYREVECVGYPGTYPVTPAQLEQLAQFAAHDSIATGLPISRATVGEHSDVNTVTRPHCANLTEAQLGALIARANAVKAALLAPPEADMPGIRFSLDITAAKTDADRAKAIGTASIVGTGHDLVNLALRKPDVMDVPDGHPLGVVLTGSIDEDVPGIFAAGERAVFYNVAGYPGLHASPWRDLGKTFAQIPTPAPAGPTAADVSAAYNAALDAAGKAIAAVPRR